MMHARGWEARRGDGSVSTAFAVGGAGVPIGFETFPEVSEKAAKESIEFDGGVREARVSVVVPARF